MDNLNAEGIEPDVAGTPDAGQAVAEAVEAGAEAGTPSFGDALDIFDEDPAEGGEQQEEAKAKEAPAPDPAKAKADEKGQESAPKPDGGDLNFEVVAADGSKQDLELPEGTKLVFKGDKKTVEVGSMKDLVTFAQKGVFMERRTQEFATTERKLTEQLSGLQGAVQQRDAKLEQAEQTLLKILFDPKALKQAQDAAKPYRDPEMVKGRKAQAELERRREEDAQKVVEAVQQKSAQYWEELGGKFTSLVSAEEAAKEFPYLRSEDTPTIVAGVWQAHESFRTAVFEDLVKNGVEEQDAANRAAVAAVRWLAEEEAETLRSVAQELNGIYAARVGDKGASPASRGKAQPDPKADPTQHNERTQKKLDERSRQTLRGAGATPSGTTTEGTPKKEGGQTWGDVWDDIGKEFDAFVKE